MQNIILIVHLILAVCLIGVVLLQRSEGGALGIGGGGGGLVSARGAGNALSKLTWFLGAGFLCTSILLTIVAGGGEGSLLDRFDQGDIPLPDTGTGAVTAPSDELDLPLPDLPTIPGAAE